MLSEKIVFALNNVDDSYLEEAEDLLDNPAATQHTINKRTLHVLLIAAVLAALLTACAVGYSIHQRRQQELRESLNFVSGKSGVRCSKATRSRTCSGRQPLIFFTLLIGK